MRRVSTLAACTLSLLLLFDSAVVAQVATPTTAEPVAGAESDSEESVQISEVVAIGSAILGTLLGTIAGVVTSEILTRRRERRANEERRRAVRMALTIEIEENQNALTNYRRTVEERAKDDNYWGDWPTDLAYQFVHTPMPAWNKLMWESHASMLSVALSQAELTSLQQTYQDFATITLYRQQLAAYLASDDAAVVNAGSEDHLRVRRYFPERAPELWSEIERLMDVVLSGSSQLTVAEYGRPATRGLRTLADESA